MIEGQIILFESSIDKKYISAKGTIIDQCSSESYTVLIIDVFIGNSNSIGKVIEVYKDEISLKGDVQYPTKYKPRKLNYNGSKFN